MRQRAHTGFDRNEPSLNSVLPGVLVCAVLFAGCYGSTEPATNIGEDSATLNGRGTANNGPATSYIEYLEPSPPGFFIRRTPSRSWPAGASGPISEPVTDLLVASQYSFRLCGNDAGRPPVCAQTRTFDVPAPSGDYVKGHLVSRIGMDLTIGTRLNVRSGPHGENQRGTAQFWFDNERPAPPGRPIICMAVAANRARVIYQAGPSAWVTIVVQDQPDALSVGVSQTPLTQCTAPTSPFSSQVEAGDIVIHDAP